MSYASTCPGAITGLLAALRRSLDIDPGVTLVTDGMGITDQAADEVISVGFAGTGEGAADGQLAGEGAGGDRDREQYTVRCAVGVTSGDAGEGAMVAARSRAFTLLGACGAAIKADRTLDGAVMSARISSWSLSGGQTRDGADITIRFEVSVDAYSRR